MKTVSRALKRTPAALRQKAYALGISLGHRNKRKGVMVIGWESRTLFREEAFPPGPMLATPGGSGWDPFRLRATSRVADLDHSGLANFAMR